MSGYKYVIFCGCWGVLSVKKLLYGNHFLKQQISIASSTALDFNIPFWKINDKCFTICMSL